MIVVVRGLVNRVRCAGLEGIDKRLHCKVKHANMGKRCDNAARLKKIC